MGLLSLNIRPDRNERPSERIRIITPDGDEIIIKVNKKNGNTNVQVEAPNHIPVDREAFILGEWNCMQSCNGQD